MLDQITGQIQTMTTADKLQLAAVRFRGEQARSFLQGQVSAQLDDLAGTQGLYTAYCDRKGRVLANGWLLADGEDSVLFVMRQDLTQIVAETIGRYAMFSEVEVDTVGAPDLPPYADKAWPELWREGYVLVAEQSSGLFTPHMLNADEMGALCFDKGCYIGQEVIARTHYLGKVKKRFSLLTLSADATTPEPGSKVICPDTGRKGLAIDSEPDGDALLVAAVVGVDAD